MFIFLVLQLHFVHGALRWNGSYGVQNVWIGDCISDNAEFARAIPGIQNSCLDYGGESFYKISFQVILWILQTKLMSRVKDMSMSS